MADLPEVASVIDVEAPVDDIMRHSMNGPELVDATAVVHKGGLQRCENKEDRAKMVSGRTAAWPHHGLLGHWHQTKGGSVELMANWSDHSLINLFLVGVSKKKRPVFVPGMCR